MKTTATTTIMLIFTLASSAMAEGCDCKASTGPVVRALNGKAVFIWPNSPGTEQDFNFVLDGVQLDKFIRDLSDARVSVRH